MNDFEFIVGLMRDNYEAVGFLPRIAVSNYLTERSHVLIPNKGYLLYENPKPYQILRIAQSCVDYDLRQRGYGQQMIAQVIADAEAHYVSAIRLRCAENLDANNFWAAMGFEKIRILSPDNQRHRRINVWQKTITAGLFESLTSAEYGWREVRG